jgi:RNA polymerase sigma factor for flagellar operon FliA
LEERKDTAEIPDLDDHIKNIKILAAKIYKKYAVKGMELEDLVSEGIVGLYDAWNRFDESRGVAFKTYAHYRIRGNILDSIRRWLPCNHQTAKQERIDLITKFERYSTLERHSRQLEEMEISLNYIEESDLIEKLLDPLSEEDKKIIKKTLQEETKLNDVAEEFGITKNKVVDLRNNAIETIKEEAENLGIDSDTLFKEN